MPEEGAKLGDVGESMLVVHFCGDQWEVGPDSELTYGRVADLSLDDHNSCMDPIVGRFRFENGLWWVDSLAAGVRTVIIDRLSTSRIEIEAGTSTPVAFSNFVVQFRSGPARYSAECVVVRSSANALDLMNFARHAPLETQRLELNVDHQWGNISTTDEERAMLVEFARSWLTADCDFPIPSLPANRVVAETLGWSVTKLNRKLDYLCLRLDRAGVAGLVGDAGRLASDRRERLLNHAINARLVTPGDFPEHVGAHRAAAV